MCPSWPATPALVPTWLRAGLTVDAHVRRDVVRGGEQRAIELDHSDHLSKARLARVSSRPDLGSASLGFEPCAAYAGVALAPRRTQRALVGGRGLEREGRQEHPWVVKGRDIRRLLHRLPEAPCAAIGVWAVAALLWSAWRSQEPGASAPGDQGSELWPYRGGTLTMLAHPHRGRRRSCTGHAA